MTNSAYTKLVRIIKDQNKKYSLFLTPVDRREWPDAICDPLPDKLYRSADFVVQEYHLPGSPIRLTISRTMIDRTGEWMSGITWDELQDIKRQCGFGDKWAIEIFPDDRHLVNVASMRHLWLVDEAPAFAWKRGR